MSKRDDVIRGLKCSVCPTMPCGNCSYFVRNENDPDTGWCDRNAIYKDALELLKEQEPRMLTLTELWHMEHKPVYIQRKNSRLYVVEPAIVLKTERCYIPSLGDSYILMRENKIHDKYWACGYNVTWRCWTARPTDEQREATPWE